MRERRVLGTTIWWCFMRMWSFTVSCVRSGKNGLVSVSFVHLLVFRQVMTFWIVRSWLVTVTMSLMLTSFGTAWLSVMVMYSSA